MQQQNTLNKSARTPIKSFAVISAIIFALGGFVSACSAESDTHINATKADDTNNQVDEKAQVTEASLLTKRYLISGKVQDVGFRAATQAKARSLSVSGWVQNLKNGQVELSATGSVQQMDQLEKWLQSGPPAANVSDVTIANSTEVSSKAADNTGFDIRY